MIMVAVFAGLFLLVLLARVQPFSYLTNPGVTGQLEPGSGDGSTLFVYVHGLDRGKHWPAMREVLEPHGDTLRISYRWAAISNADPRDVTRRITGEIDREVDSNGYERIVLIGQSMGALLVKRLFLDAEESDRAWTSRVARIVLVAGMNRGWDISGQKPADMSFPSWFSIWAMTWLARTAGIGGLVLAMETGAPFVANLRMDWIRHMSRPSNPDIEIVQLLGDIDDLVSAEDNKDLTMLGSGRFTWIKVRGTGHGNIVDFADRTKAGELELGQYRREKFALATTEADFDKLARANEVLPFQPDPDVTHVVFVVHGIRDLGEWAAAFEQELQKQFAAGRERGKLAVASVRYGYFGMGPFLLKPVRETYVKWLMDEYTETLARYPNASEVHFVGHSNGTYLLAAALERYDSLNIGRVVFGGSVVRQDYPWGEVLGRRGDRAPIASMQGAGPQGPRVVNYTAVDDWVVALFPRFFEPAPMTILKNDIGSAGFNGFSLESSMVKNVDGLTGGHAAFLSRIPEIAAFILEGEEVDAAAGSSSSASNGSTGSLLAGLSSWGSRWGTWVVVWPLIAALVILVGWHVITAASEPRWPIFLAYAGLLLMILRSV